jgi:beta-glucosidase
MTLEEKVGQLNQYSVGEATGPKAQRTAYATMIEAGQIGSLFNVATAAEVNAYQEIAVKQSRLHIPILFGLDVIHGFRTIFPVNLGLSASWDLGLVERAARLAATEAAAQGIRWTFSPMVDVARDARWGRIAEGAGEDPYLGARIGEAYVRGYQGRHLDDPTSVLACAKHFVGYGAAEAGRDYNTTELSERTLRQVYLPPFQACARAGVATVMAAFNAVDGVPASANPFTLGEVLRKEWGFRGVVVSDWDSIVETMAHGTADSEAVAAKKSFLAGIDVDMESGLFVTQLPGLVRSGAVPMSRVDEAVGRVLRLKRALGLFDAPFASGGQAAATLPESSRSLARLAAEESFVLLKNVPFVRSPLLPLTTRHGLRIALVGPLADSAQDMLGPWSARGLSTDVVTLRAALEARAVREGFVVSYARGCDVLGEDASDIADAVAAAKHSDVILVALGERGHLTGEAASRAHLDLSGRQEQLLEAVAATGKPVVLLVFNGRPLTIRWAAEHVPAILDAWFPGIEAGHALVRVLFGDVNPSGHLTATFPRSVGQEPLYYNALSTGRPLNPIERPPNRYTSRYIDESNAPLFPFGFGLSYTTFDYGPTLTRARTVSARAIEKGATLTVTAEIRNLGPRAGSTVAQCYIRLTGTSVARPVRELKSFARITLEAGAARQLKFHLGRDELAFWGIERRHSVEPARLEVWISADSVSGESAVVDITN